MLEELFKQVKSRVAVQTRREQGESRLYVPSNLVWRCPKCMAVSPSEEFEKGRKVCPSCGYHARLGALERINLTVDKNTFEEFDSAMESKNPLSFPGYNKKISSAQESTGLREAVVTGICTIRGEKCVIGAMDSRFMMASMGSVVGEKITRAFEYATEHRLPIIMFTASGGARMQEGIISLMQMAKTSGAVSRHNKEGLLYISVMTDPTTGGVTASFASLGDIIISEPGTLIGFAGRRVIEGTINEKLPDDFQTAEFLLEHGFIDIIVNRNRMRSTLAHLLKLHKETSREGE